MKHRHHLRIAALTIFLVTGLIMGTYSTSTAQPTLNFKRVVNNWPTIELYFTVGCNGTPTWFTDKSFFKVAEDGVEIPNFDLWCPDPTLRCAISIAIVFDASGSMMGAGNAGAKAAGLAFVDLMDGVIDEGTVLWFNTQVTVFQSMTPNKDLLRNAVNALPASGGSAVWDGIYYGVMALVSNGVNQCRSVIVLTDGGDNASSHSPPEIISLATKNRIRVFAVGVGSGINSAELQAIANLTGGRYFETPNANQLAAIYQEISTIMYQGFQECLITYTAHCKDGTTRLVDLNVVNFCGGSDVKSKTYKAERDTTTFTPIAIRIGTSKGQGASTVRVPLELMSQIQGELMNPAAFEIGYNPACVTFSGIDAPAGTLLNGVPFSFTPTANGVNIQMHVSRVLNATQVPATLADLIFTASDPPGQDSVLCPLTALSCTFPKGCLRPVFTGGKITVTPRKPELSCTLNAPASLSWSQVKKDYAENSFLVTMAVFNAGYAIARNARFKLHVDPQDFILVSPKEDSVSGTPKDVSPNGSSTAMWELRALRRMTSDSVRLSVTGSFDNTPDITCGSKIWIPKAELDLLCNISAPTVHIDTSAKSYSPMPFDVTATVTNFSQTTTDTVFATLTVPPDLHINGPGGPTTLTKKLLPEVLAPAQQGSVTWTLWHPVTAANKHYIVSFHANTANLDSAVCEMNVDIPGLELPSLEAACTVPDSLRYSSGQGVYTPNPFPVAVTGVNIGGASTSNTTAFLYLPKDVVLADPGDSLRKTFNPSTMTTYTTGPKPKVSWNVRYTKRPRVDEFLDFHIAVGGVDLRGFPVDTAHSWCRVKVPGLPTSYNCDLRMPDSLEMNTAGTNVQPNPFAIRYRVWNTSQQVGKIMMVDLKYATGDDLVLDPSTPKTVNTNATLNPGDTLTLSWLMHVTNRLTRRLAHIFVSTFDDEGNPVTGTPPCSRDLPISNVTTIVGVRQEHAPGTFALGQCIPNPFSSSTIIPYSVGANARVTIEIYNILGTRIAHLLSVERGPGNFQVSWNGTDDHGRRAASGVYLYRMQATREDGLVFKQTRNVVLSW